MFLTGSVSLRAGIVMCNEVEQTKAVCGNPAQQIARSALHNLLKRVKKALMRHLRRWIATLAFRSLWLFEPKRENDVGSQ